MAIGSFNIWDLVDIDNLKPLLVAFSAATDLAVGLLVPGSDEFLLSTGWRNICSKFHHIHPESAQLCKASNLQLATPPMTAGEIRIAPCAHDLMVGGTPLIIEDHHLADLFVGQVLFAAPDIRTYRQKAQRFGYDEVAYLAALREVPVVSQDKFQAGLHLLSLLASTVAKIGLANLHSHAQQRHIESQKALLNCLINSIPDLIFYKDRAGVYLGCNRAFAERMGKPEEEIVGSNDFALFSEEIACTLRENDRIMLASGQTKRYQEWISYPDDRQAMVEIVKAPYIGPAGQILGLVGISRDITRLKNAEIELAKERELLLVTLRSLGEGVIATDNDGLIRLINEVAEQLTGWNQQEASGRAVAEIFRILNPETGQPCATSVQQVLESGNVANSAAGTVLVSRDGNRYHIVSSAAPIRNTNGSIIGTVLVFRDVSEQLRMEQALKRVDKLESLGVLAGGVAHDFNNILTAIVGNIELAGQLIDPNHQVQELLTTAEKASWRAKDLTQQLLTFAQGGHPIKETTSITSIIKDSAQFVLYGSGVSCDFEIADDLWLVEIDTGQISQVIQNLVLNARHAMPGGGRIAIACRNVPAAEAGFYLQHPGKPHICITVRDTGVGIPTKNLSSIFDPYFSTKQEGSGLGLAIVHSIINKHDGYIEVQSEPAQGTTFSIFLPVADRDSAPKKPQQTGLRRGSGTIMIMDDEASLVEVTERILNHLGYRTVTARDGAEATERFRELQRTGKPVEAVIMDLTIPGGMGGKEAVQEILKIDPRAKVIAASGYSSDPIISQFRNYGFCGAICKPFRIDALARVLAEVIPDAPETPDKG